MIGEELSAGSDLAHQSVSLCEDSNQSLLQQTVIHNNQAAEAPSDDDLEVVENQNISVIQEEVIEESVPEPMDDFNDDPGGKSSSFL